MNGEQHLETALRRVDAFVGEAMSSTHRSLKKGSKKRLAATHEPGETRKQTEGRRKLERDKAAQQRVDHRQRTGEQAIRELMGVGKGPLTRETVQVAINTKDQGDLPAITARIRAAQSRGDYDLASQLEVSRAILIDQVNVLKQFRLNLKH